MRKAKPGECGFDRHAAMSGIEHRGKELQIFGGGEQALEGIGVADVMDLFCECPAGQGRAGDRAPTERQQPGESAQKSRFSGAVRSRDGQAPTRIERERQI